MFSRACEYAFQAVLYITVHTNNGVRVGVKEIADAQNIPLPFLSKILQKLVKAKILTSTKGPRGGFALNDTPDKITLLHIVDVIDGLKIFERCGIGLKHCSDSAPCPIHQEFMLVKSDIRMLLSTKTLESLAKDFKKGKFVLYSA